MLKLFLNIRIEVQQAYENKFFHHFFNRHWEASKVWHSDFAYAFLTLRMRIMDHHSAYVYYTRDHDSAYA